MHSPEVGHLAADREVLISNPNAHQIAFPMFKCLSKLDWYCRRKGTLEENIRPGRHDDEGWSGRRPRILSSTKGSGPKGFFETQRLSPSPEKNRDRKTWKVVKEKLNWVQSLTRCVRKTVLENRNSFSDGKGSYNGAIGEYIVGGLANSVGDVPTSFYDDRKSESGENDGSQCSTTNVGRGIVTT